MFIVNNSRKAYKAPWCETGALLESLVICASGDSSTEDFSGDFPEYTW